MNRQREIREEVCGLMQKQAEARLPFMGFSPCKIWDRDTHRGLFAPLLQAVYYARLLKIVGRHFKLDSIANHKTNESLPHFSR